MLNLGSRLVELNPNIEPHQLPATNLVALTLPPGKVRTTALILRVCSGTSLTTLLQILQATDGQPLILEARLIPSQLSEMTLICYINM